MVTDFDILPKREIAVDVIRHAVSELYFTEKHIHQEGRIDDQEHQLFLAKFKQIEVAIENQSQ